MVVVCLPPGLRCRATIFDMMNRILFAHFIQFRLLIPRFQCNFLAAMSKLAIQDRMEEVELDRAKRTTYSRTLKGLHKQDPSIDVESEANLKLVGALKLMGHTCISRQIWNDAAKKIIKTEEFSELVWCQTKSQQPDLDKHPILKDWLVPPEKIRTDNLNKDLYWFVDAHAPSCLEMKGSVQRKVSVMEVSEVVCSASSNADGGGAALEKLAPSGQEEEMLGAEVAVGSGGDRKGGDQALVGGQVAPPDAVRMLRCDVSNPNDEKETEQLAMETRTLCGQGLYFSPNPFCANNAHFKTKMWLSYLKVKKADANGVITLAGHEKVFLRFLISWLLEGDTYGCMDEYMALVKEAKSIHAELVPVMADAINVILSIDVDAPWQQGDDKANEQRLLALGLNPKQIMLLCNSAFYKGFAKARFEKLIASVKSMKDKTTRLSLVEMLLGEQTIVSEAEVTELKFIRSILKCSPLQKAQYLLSSERLFAFLDSFFPGDEDGCLRHCANGVKFKDCPAKDFTRAILRIRALPGSVEFIANPAVKTCLTTFEELVQAKGGQQPECTRFCAVVFAELLVAKLGLKYEPTSGHKLSDIDGKFLLAVSNVAQAALKSTSKIDEKRCPTLAELFRWAGERRLAEATEASAQAAEALSKCVSESRDIGECDVVASILADSRLQPTARGVGEKIDSTGVGGGGGGGGGEGGGVQSSGEKPASYIVGQEVTIVVAKKHAELYLNMRAKVVKVKSFRHDILELEILEGPEKGTKISRPATSVTLSVDVEEKQQLVPVAGKRALVCFDSNSSAAKIAKVEAGASAAQKIEDIFGAPVPQDV